MNHIIHVFPLVPLKALVLKSSIAYNYIFFLTCYDNLPTAWEVSVAESLGMVRRLMS